MPTPLEGNLSLLSRHVLVCGASSGIGKATAKAVASMGADVTVLARNRDALEALVPVLKATGAPRARAIAVDLRKRDETEKSVRALLDAHGPVHVLVNNAGGPKPGLLLDTDEKTILQGIELHLLASHLLVRLVLPGMAEGYGRIINILSTSVREPIPHLGVSNIVRASMAAWAKTLSRELPPGVTINNVLPGYTATERLVSLAESTAKRTGQTRAEVEAEWKRAIPEGRLASPSEIAAAIAFLATPAASYVRGVSLHVDGGRMHVI